jgi:hypothetical protein
MKKLVLPMLLALGTIMWAGGAFAVTHPGAYTIADTIEVEMDRTRSDLTYGWTDHVGTLRDFNFHGIDITLSGGVITFDFFTNFDHDGIYTNDPDWTPDNPDLPDLPPYTHLYAYLADFAIDVDGLPGYEYGIVFIDHDQWNQGGTEDIDPTLTDLDPGLYRATAWDASSHFFENAAANYLYGGRYDEGNPRTPNVAIADYDPGFYADVSISGPIDLGGTGADPGDPMFQWTVSMNAADIGFTGGTMSVFWGGANCANDVIAGTVTLQDDNPVPEPATLVLTGFGLIGLVVIWRSKNRRRFRKK